MIRQLWSILLSSLLMLSQLGLSSSFHFCGDWVSESALHFGQEHLSCGMETSNQCEKPAANGISISKKDCCKNQNVELDIEDIVVAEKHNLIISQRMHNMPLIQILPAVEGFLSGNRISGSDPPSSDPPLRILNQSFLL